MKYRSFVNVLCIVVALFSVDGTWISNQAVPGYVVQHTRAFRERLLAPSNPY